MKKIKWNEKRLSDIDIIIDGHGQIMTKDDLQAFNSFSRK
jgi:flavorubredoxin